jgi:SAM-dependent methyltransferase
MRDFTYCAHFEKNVDNFTALDGTVRFYNFVKAVMLGVEAREVLDFGAGRGAFWEEDTSAYRRELRDLRSGGATVTACDVDRVVLTHPCSHRQIVVYPSEPLPFADHAFDVIVSDMAFEHIENATQMANELLRVLKPGGYVCARTPNRLGYVRMMASLIPNQLHVTTLRRVQPDRKPEDVFPTFYRLNSPEQVRRAFVGCDVFYFFDCAEPAYFFSSRALYTALLIFHKMMPTFLAPGICLFIRKPTSKAAA